MILPSRFYYGNASIDSLTPPARIIIVGVESPRVQARLIDTQLRVVVN